MNRITVDDIRVRKGKRKITMLTCYDYSMAHALDEAGLDIILIGDSMANVVLALKETRTISIEEMLNHTKAVAHGVRKALVVADMPSCAYQEKPSEALGHARRFLEAGAQAVKIEWFNECEEVVQRLIQNKVPVMGHIGLTPQTAHLLGGYKIQGRDEDSAQTLCREAALLEKIGVFSLVLECIPAELGRRITGQLAIPTIGIGAGKYCDGQVLVLYDFLGLYPGKRPKFARVYADVRTQIKAAASRFINDVEQGTYPSDSESFF